MIARERVEGSQLHPAGAQLLIGVSTKAADVRTNQRDSKHVEVQYACVGVSQ